MASTAHKTEAEVAEHYDDPDTLAHKLDTLAGWVKESQYFTAFTGAGISTSAGIPDFRGPNGVWTQAARGNKITARHHEMLGCNPTDGAISAAEYTIEACAGHMALIGLQQAGFLKHLISTNTDGLHLRSGFPSKQFTELHGNTNSEGCPTQPIGACAAPYAGGGCGALYFRDERCRAEGLTAFEHATGRECPKCGRPLQDTVINFNENLWPDNVESARAVAGRSDLMMTVGSSLRVSSWAPQAVARNGKLVVLNLQWTPLDDIAALKINAKSDVVFKGLCERLNVAIPQFSLRRHLTVSVAKGQIVNCRAAEIKRALRSMEDPQVDRQMRGADKHELAALLAANGHSCAELTVNATDPSGTLYAWMTTVKLLEEGNSAIGGGFLNKSPQVRDQGNVTSMSLEGTTLLVGVTGRFKEPPLEIRACDLPPMGQVSEYCFEYPVGEHGGSWRAVTTVPVCEPPEEVDSEQSLGGCEGSTERIQSSLSTMPDPTEPPTSPLFDNTESDNDRSNVNRTDGCDKCIVA